MAPERGKNSPSTVAAECGADEILVVNIYVLINLCSYSKYITIFIYF